MGSETALRLSTAVEGLDAELSPGPDPEVNSVTHDSRRVRPGSLFACIPGEHFDGHDYAAVAKDSGATALLTERHLNIGLPEVAVANVRRALGVVSSRVYGDPSHKLEMVGITGTNGKTTTASMIASIFRARGQKVEVIGTLTQKRTTPEAPELQEMLGSFVAKGVEAVVMEVSSHALTLGRVAGTRYDAAIFTNLGRDHLDFHHDLESYFAAKSSLFQPSYTSLGVVNCDDPFGRRILQSGSVAMKSFSHTDADELTLGATGSRFRVGDLRIELPLAGHFNVMNALSAISTSLCLGVPSHAIEEGLASLPAVPGRFERVANDLGLNVIVDYAHTPDALETVLVAARGLVAPRSRLLVVFGAGGDRDPGKRPMMAAAVGSHADVIAVTDDNPRSEDPAAIRSSLLAGLGKESGVAEIADRRLAIRWALERTLPGDVLLIAGKGHEVGQDYGGRVEEFDDKLVASEEMRKL